MNKSVVFEPAAGDGAIANLLEEFGFLVTLRNDIDNKHEKLNLCLDASREEHWEQLFIRPDYVISNPPWESEACFSIVRNAKKYAKVGVAMLLRLSWLEPTILREAWLKENPPDTLIVLPRYSFKQNGKTDSMTSAWFIWDSNCKRGVVVASRIETLKEKYGENKNITNASLATQSK
jgi:hypothetical protein